MTNGDRLREMSDDEFEKFLRYKINACCRQADHCDRCESPCLARAAPEKTDADLIEEIRWRCS